MLQPTIPATAGLQLPWSWCARCQRAYVSGSYRVIHPGTSRVRRGPEAQLCPYYDCSGSASRDRWLWSTLRFEHPEYPEQPEPYQIYVR